MNRPCKVGQPSKAVTRWFANRRVAKDLGLGTLLLLNICFFFAGITLCGKESGQGGRVMTWVPPYAISHCKERLSESYDGLGMKDGLTHLGLQFWNPTKSGGIQYVSRFREKITDETILEFRDWGQANNVKTLLCIYNATSSGWEWDLAKSAFGPNHNNTVESLVRETKRLGLDGVDIDFEGKGELDSSRESFVRFIKELSGRLHAEGLELTLNTFAYKWHAPNQTWWADLLPHVDGLQVMGYEETGAGASAWRSYEFIKAAAGKHSAKLLIGVPSFQGQWQDKPVREHLQWIVDDKSVGLAIWDAQLKDPAWRRRDTWKMIYRIKFGKGPPQQ